MNTQYDTICNGRNRIVIVGDARVPVAMANGTSVPHTAVDASARLPTVNYQTLAFAPVQ